MDKDKEIQLQLPPEGDLRWYGYLDRDDKMYVVPYTDDVDLEAIKLTAYTVAPAKFYVRGPFKAEDKAHAFLNYHSLLQADTEYLMAQEQKVVREMLIASGKLTRQEAFPRAIEASEEDYNLPF